MRRSLSKRDALRLLDKAGMPWTKIRGEIVSAPLLEKRLWASRAIYLGNVPAKDWNTGGLAYQVRGSWTGQVLLVPPTRTPDELTHELCHWIVATPDRRKRQEFRLGPAPWSDVYNYNPASWLESGQRDEEMTCAVQIILMHRLGFDWRVYARNNNFDFEDGHTFDYFWTAVRDRADTPVHLYAQATKRIGQDPLAWLDGFRL